MHCMVFKKQNTVKTSVFLAEFVSMKIGIEAVRGLRYKLRMIWVPLSGPTHTYVHTYMYGNNMYIIHNTQRPKSTLNKKVTLLYITQ